MYPALSAWSAMSLLAMYKDRKATEKLDLLELKLADKRKNLPHRDHASLADKAAGNIREHHKTQDNTRITRERTKMDRFFVPNWMTLPRFFFATYVAANCAYLLHKLNKTPTPTEYWQAQLQAASEKE
jgi:hypothetical protein